MKPPGCILWRGLSKNDGKPIVVIAQYESKNGKTGNTIQIWIIRSHQHPTEAIRTGGDFSICGDCPMRYAVAEFGRMCYVDQRAIMSVWNAYKRGSYPLATADDWQLFRDRIVRIGTYGDPFAVPMKIWRRLARRCMGWVGYTHQWRKPCAQCYADLFMASVDFTSDDAQLAQSMGWRTFTAIGPGQTPRPEHGIECLHASDGIQCCDCRLCDGNNHPSASNVWTHAHGSPPLMHSIQLTVNQN